MASVNIFDSVVYTAIIEESLAPTIPSMSFATGEYYHKKTRSLQTKATDMPTLTPQNHAPQLRKWRRSRALKHDTR